MRLRSVSVTDYRCLSGPVTLAFGPGLNVIYGPNESGKTTLLEAIYTVLTLPATTTGKRLQILKPRTGGVPSVELEFDVGETRWTVKKTYAGKKGKAFLRCEHEGTMSEFEGDVAEARLRTLWTAGEESGRRSSEAGGLWPVLYARHREGPNQPGPRLGEQARQSLGERLAALSGEVLAGPAGAQLLAAAQARYEQFYIVGTGNPTNRADAPLRQVREAEQAASAALTGHRELHGRWSARLEELASVEADIEEIETSLEDLEPRADAAQDVVAGLEQQRQALASAEQRLATAQASADAAGERWGRRQEQIAAVETLVIRIAKGEADVAEADREAEVLRAPLEASQTRRDAAEIALRTAQRMRRRGDAQLRQLELDVRAGALTKEIESLREAGESLEEAIEAMALIEVDDDSLRELEALSEGAAAATWAWEAAGASLEVTALKSLQVTWADHVEGLEKGQVARRVVGDREVLRLGDLAEISVDVGGAEQRERREQAEAASATLTLRLESLGCDDLAAAREQARRRAELEATIQASRPIAQRLQTVQEEAADVAGRIQVVAAEFERFSDAGDEPVPEQDEATCRRWTEALAAAETAAELELAEAGAVAQTRSTVWDEHRQRHQQLEQALALEVDRRIELDEELKTSRVTDSDDALVAAVASWNEALETEGENRAKAATVLEDAGAEAAALTAQRLASAVVAAREELTSTQARRSELVGALAAGEVDGLHERIGEAEAALVDAAEARAHWEREARSAKRLFDVLEACRRRTQALFLEPLQEAAEPLLSLAFPGATLDWTENFSVATLQRRERGVDTVDQLSAGASEQLGLLVRLAMALVLGGDEGLPVLLDDALAVTDKERFGRFANLLFRVSERLQLIVVTCHWERYRSLGVPAQDASDFAALIEG